MIELTESAAAAIRTAMTEAEGPVGGLRILVESGGCAGNKYMMGLVAGGEPSDLVIKKDDLTIYVDGDSAQLLNGLVIDFTVGLQGSGFTFTNPNAASSCSCGKSFG